MRTKDLPAKLPQTDNVITDIIKAAIGVLDAYPFDQHPDEGSRCIFCWHKWSGTGREPIHEPDCAWVLLHHAIGKAADDDGRELIKASIQIAQESKLHDAPTAR